MKPIKQNVILALAIMSMIICVFVLMKENAEDPFLREETAIHEGNDRVLRDAGLVDWILAGTSIAVTIILGAMTYVQTKEEMRLDEIDKIPYFQIDNFKKYEQISSQEYHIGSPQYSYIPRLQFVTCDSDDTGLIFKISLKNVTDNTIAKANVYYAEEKIKSYRNLKRLPISEKLKKVIRNANNTIELLECDGRNINDIIEELGEDGKTIKDIVIARDETVRVLNEIEELFTPDMIDYKKGDVCEIELITYFNDGENITKYLNDYSPVNFYIAIDLETLYGYRYTQVIYMALRYANIYSEGNESMKLVFSVQDFESKVLPVTVKKVDWNMAFSNDMRKTAKKIKKEQNFG